MSAPTATTIASLDDSRVAPYRHIGDTSYLSEHRLFVAEGRRVVARLLSAPSWQVQSVLVTPTALDSLATVFAQTASRAPVYVVDQTDMNAIVGFNIHRGCLALAARPADRTLAENGTTGVSRVVMLEGVNNPDNVGGIFRSAAAFGADLVVLGPDCGDPFYRKAIRTSMAATLHVPFVLASQWPAAIGLMRDSGFTVIALTPSAAANPLSKVSLLSRRLALLVGAEGDGLTPEAISAASLTARIPMSAQVDSLNVATAASIAMYHLFGEQ